MHVGTYTYVPITFSTETQEGSRVEAQLAEALQILHAIEDEHNNYGPESDCDSGCGVRRFFKKWGE